MGQDEGHIFYSTDFLSIEKDLDFILLIVRILDSPAFCFWMIRELSSGSLTSTLSEFFDHSFFYSQAPVLPLMAFFLKLLSNSAKIGYGKFEAKIHAHLKTFMSSYFFPKLCVTDPAPQS